MSGLFWNGGRLAWPPVLAALFSTVTLVVTDYIWRMVQAPMETVAICGGLALLIGNIAIFRIATRPRRPA